MSSITVFPFILVIFLLTRLRATVKADLLVAKWGDRIRQGFGIAIILVALEIFFKTAPFTWLFYLYVLLLIYLIHKEPDFQSRKPVAMAILPYIVLGLFIELIKYFAPHFYTDWDTYFSTAVLLTVAWMAAMWFNSNKQHKMLVREREKMRLEAEMNKAIAARKIELEGEVAERTNELMRQKEELENALEELRATQDQLVQQEKLASLGELTAGIAHEIQNPLNFVNNFSEVSIELLEELETGIKNGDNEEVIAIAADIKQNLQKISQHGKRADGIVKGMLQHSRKSTGQKEPTDINTLADEYLRLSYHGLRAKDKSFNATLKTNFDEQLEKIPAVSQELGRVLLNMFNNAFYAVSDRKKQQPHDFEPTVSVTTAASRLQTGQEAIEITIRDNGMGIPQHIIDKIYQPFFTTKPTGEGTGLGLSLSYDIITKVHGGELALETKEGEFTAFTITLPTLSA